MEITLKTVLNFGKYKGLLVEDLLYNTLYDIEANNICVNRVPYFLWLQSSTKHKLTKDVLDRIDILFEKKKNFMKDIPQSSEKQTYGCIENSWLWGEDVYSADMFF